MSMSRPITITMTEVVGGNVAIKTDPPMAEIILMSKDGTAGPQAIYALKFAELAIRLSQQIKHEALAGFDFTSGT